MGPTVSASSTAQPSTAPPAAAPNPYAGAPGPLPYPTQPAMPMPYQPYTPMPMGYNPYGYQQPPQAQGYPQQQYYQAPQQGYPQQPPQGYPQQPPQGYPPQQALQGYPGQGQAYPPQLTLDILHSQVLQASHSGDRQGIYCWLNLILRIDSLRTIYVFTHTRNW